MNRRDNGMSRSYRVHQTNHREPRDWRKILIRQAVAWIALALIGVAIWQMADRMLPSKAARETVVAQPTTTQTVPKQTTSSTAKQKQVKVIARTLNLRTKPSVEEGQVVMRLRRSTLLTVLSQTGNWYEVETADGKRGYVNSDSRFVSIVR